VKQGISPESEGAPPIGLGTEVDQGPRGEEWQAGGMRWMLVGAPLNSSAEPGGEALAPRALRAAELRERLSADDAGDIEGWGRVSATRPRASSACLA
jgi:hypothetical protein